MNVKVFLVDDHPFLRSGLRQVIAQRENLKVVGEASCGAEALSLAKELAPDLIVMDVHLPDTNGIELMRQILRVLPATKVVMFSGDAARTLVDEALRAGACGYIVKTGSMEEFIQAIDFVMAGRLFLSPQVGAEIIRGYQKSLSQEPELPKPKLTEREKQLLRLIAEGQRNKEIADELKLSPHSIETYRARVMKKVGCSSTAELVRFAIREGVAPL